VPSAIAALEARCGARCRDRSLLAALHAGSSEGIALDARAAAAADIAEREQVLRPCGGAADVLSGFGTPRRWAVASSTASGSHRPLGRAAPALVGAANDPPTCRATSMPLPERRSATRADR
jgi:hypothetical protein